MFFSLIISSNTYSQEKEFGTYYSFGFEFTLEDGIPLQPIIDRAKAGDTILLEGIYLGPIIITTDGLIIDGQGKSEIN